MNGPKFCPCCGEEIIEGRSDKRFCNKRCYNRWKNTERRELMNGISNCLRAYTSSYTALKRLFHTYGAQMPIKMTEAIQNGLDRSAPFNPVIFHGYEGEWVLIGDIAYQASKDLKSLVLLQYKKD